MLRIVFIAALATLAAACATVTRGTTDQVQINSNPPEAQARTSMGYACITPCTLQAGRKDEFTVIFSKPGYHTAEMPVVTHIAGAGAAGFAGNVILGGVVGMGVDATTGATLEHFPNPVTVTLVPLKKGEPDSVIRITPELPTQSPKRSIRGRSFCALASKAVDKKFHVFRTSPKQTSEVAETTTQ